MAQITDIRSIVRQWDGKPISQPGIISGIPLETYHQRLTVEPSISSSGLRTIEDRSPAHYFANSYLNPKATPFQPTEAMVMGSAAHHIFTGEAGFNRQFAVRPETYPNDLSKAWNGNSNDCKAWLAARKEEGREVLKPEQLDHIEGMAEALERHEAVREGILSGLVEHSMVWQDPITGIWLKSRPDCLPVDSDIGSDLKTIISADHDTCCRSLTDNGYHLQVALAMEGYEQLTGRKLSDFFFVFVEKTPPYAVAVKAIDFVDIDYARRQLRRSINRFATCLETGEWPGYEDDNRAVTLMPWKRSALSREAENKTLPAWTDPPYRPGEHQPKPVVGAD